MKDNTKTTLKEAIQQKNTICNAPISSSIRKRTGENKGNVRLYKSFPSVIVIYNMILKREIINLNY